MKITSMLNAFGLAAVFLAGPVSAQNVKWERRFTTDVHTQTHADHAQNRRLPGGKPMHFENNE